MARFLSIAHRGASGSFPENTRVAFEQAIALGADMIELDCQQSRDGHVVVFHDERLNRTAGAKGRVYEKTLEQLKKLDVGAWWKRAFKGERILTLEEALEILVGSADLCLEIKCYPGAPPGIEIKLLFILSHYDYLDRTVIASFDYPTLSRVRELAPEARLGVIYGQGVKQNPLDFAARIGAASILVQKEFATSEFLNNTWEAGLDVHVWTVNEFREMEGFASRGVQGIVSDFPERLSQLKTGYRWYKREA
jgi:glycerophosphoryl diester phosphodiesterase